VLTARDRALQREAELFDVIRQHAIEHIPALQRLAAAVAQIDAAAGLAYLADERRYVRPEIIDEPIVEIRDGRHPVIERMLAEKFVPNDCDLGKPAPDSGERETLVILTGPNMAGKSTYIRQVALLTLLAQTGSYVPAAAMRLRPVDRIFARVGASDEISRGQSTFMVEMTEAANILNNATDRSLVIIDELGRGTSTFDGLALAWAIAEMLVTRVGCLTLFATHYHELTQLEDNLAGAANYNVAVREWEDQIVFLHRIIRGGTDRSYGSHVAKLAGVPPQVIERSRQLLAELESNFSSVRRAPIRTAVRTKPKKPDSQLTLFPMADEADEIVDELRKLNPNAITPLEAIKQIQKWRERLK
jgi:DNA mismatch repair protein MutS